LPTDVDAPIRQPGPAPSKAALVTGGGLRIGAAIARALGRAGYAVAVHRHGSEAAAEAVAAAIVAGGGHAAVVQADLADPEAPARLLEDAAAAVGPLTALINNAAVFEHDAVGRLDAALWDRHMAVNLRAPVFLAEAFAAALPAQARGCVVNVIDQRVLKPTPQFLSYTVAKSALLAATMTLAQALSPRIRVVGVGPGPTLPSRRQSADDFARQSAAVPLGRGPTPEEIAAAVLFLLEAESVTGVMLPVDGGQHLAWATPDVDGVGE
jgi:NAD(P)-dependent dehydrogenase (short-subunit alcohol dehydrogenase family)